MISYVNIFAHDVAAMAGFYGTLLGYSGVAAVRSPIFRALDAGSIRLGINADAAYELLSLADRRKDRGVSCYLTFELDNADMCQKCRRARSARAWSRRRTTRSAARANACLPTLTTTSSG